MSTDRTTITRAEAIRRRKEEDQKRREKAAPKIVSRLKPTPPQPKPVTPKLVPARKSVIRPKAEDVLAHRSSAASARATVSAEAASRLRRQYDIAMTSPHNRTASYSRPHAPSISLPKVGLGPRLLSFVLMGLCAVGLYFLFAMDPFIVRNASILGNSRVSLDQIAQVLGIANQPAALLNPGQIEYNILANFPDIATATVEINLPSRVVITVTERRPVVAWQQDSQTMWVDAQGYAFPPRGDVQGLVTVAAAGNPPAPDNFNPGQTIGARPFLASDLSAAIVTLSPLVPEGATMIFDPAYGLGWSDPRGWRVYFGHNGGDANLKFQVYQSMLDYLTKHEIQPTLISVEYPNAPFYRVAQ